MSQELEKDPIEQLIEEWRNGDQDAFNQLFTALHEELRLIAHRLFMRERNNHTLQTDDLIGKLYIKLLGSKTIPYTSHAHFLNSMARTMRQILIDHARTYARKADRSNRVSLQDFDHPDASAEADARQSEAGALHAQQVNADMLDRLVALNEALEKMEKLDEKMAKVANWKLSLGLTLEEIATRMNEPLGNVKREWLIARKFLGATVFGR